MSEALEKGEHLAASGAWVSSSAASQETPVIPFQIHHRIPLLRRPFYQRDQALAERNRAIAERDRAIAERDRAIAESCTARQVGPFRPSWAEPALNDEERRVVDRFHDIYYSKLDEGRGLHTIVLSWMGHEMLKCPLDLWVYQELIVASRPDVILETGTYRGGSALFLADICDLVGHGDVVTIDVDASHEAGRPRHPRITYLIGSSTAPDILARTERILGGRTNVMVVLDSDHRRDHVLEELRSYCQFVPVGGYLIVEDTNVNGHPTYPDFGPGPWEAVDAFLAENDRFTADRTRERFILTMNPRGFLRRVG